MYARAATRSAASVLDGVSLATSAASIAAWNCRWLYNCRARASGSSAACARAISARHTKTAAAPLRQAPRRRRAAMRAIVARGVQCPAVVDPRIIPREEHIISRRDIDPDALRVLYRLRQANHLAYLVGGSVRDLLLGRRPKAFDIGTSAHPYEVKRLFRNCWIVGRRFRLAHVKFGTKTIEVATFRRQVSASAVTPEMEMA